MPFQRIAVRFDSKDDDAVWDDAGNLLIPAGKRIAEEIRQILSSNGVEVSPVFQRAFYGWEVAFLYKGFSISAVIQLCEQWLIVLGENRFLPNLFYPKAIRSTLESVGAILAEAIEIKGVGSHARITNFD